MLLYNKKNSQNLEEVTGEKSETGTKGSPKVGEVSYSKGRRKVMEAKPCH